MNNHICVIYIVADPDDFCPDPCSFVKIQIVLFKYDCFVLFTVFSEFVGFNFKKCKCFQKLFQFFLVEIFWSDPDLVQAI